MAEVTCETCPHWHHATGTMEPPLGNCWRYPKTHRKDHDDWCGEHPELRLAMLKGPLTSELIELQTALGCEVSAHESCRRGNLAEQREFVDALRTADSLLSEIVGLPNVSTKWSDRYAAWRRSSGIGGRP